MHTVAMTVHGRTGKGRGNPYTPPLRAGPTSKMEMMIALSRVEMQ